MLWNKKVSDAKTQNRPKHGLTGAFEVRGFEDQERYDDLLDQFIRAEKPADIVEVELVKKMAQHTWMSRRAVRCQDACFDVLTPDPGKKGETDKVSINHTEIERWLRYQAHQDRSYARAAAELIKRRKERREEARGFESQKRAEAAEKRQENKETRQVERHQTAVAIDKTRLDREQSNAMIKAMAAAGKMDHFLPPPAAKIAA